MVGRVNGRGYCEARDFNARLEQKWIGTSLSSWEHGDTVRLITFEILYFN
jgi:hypothetical protein